MRHAVLLLLVFLWAQPVHAAWAEVQQFTAASDTGTSTTWTFTYGSNVTAGNFLVCLGKSASGVTHNSVTSDAAGDAWSVVTDSTQTGNGWITSLWYFVADESEALTVTITYSGTIGARGLACAEYSGLHASPFDVSQGNSQVNPGTGADAVTTGATAATAQDNSLAIACMVSQSTTTVYTPASGWTERVENLAWPAGSQGMECMHRNITPAGAVTATWTIDCAACDPTSIVAVFKEGAGGGGGGGGTSKLLLLGVS
jgi:hypothetical protein